MIKVFKKNFRTLFYSQLIYSYFIYLIFIPFAKYLFYLSLSLSNINYLTYKNITSYFMNPLSLIIGIALLIAICFLVLIDIYGLNIIYIASRNDEKLNLYSFFVTVYKVTIKAVKKNNIFLLIYLCLILPLISSIYNNPIIKEIKIPSFIISSLNTYYALAILFVFFIMIVFSFYNSYIFLYMLLDKDEYLNAFKKSYRLVKKTFFSLIANILFVVFIYIIISILSLLVNFYFKEFLFYNSIFLKSILVLINILASFFYNLIIKIMFVFLVSKIFFKNHDSNIKIYKKKNLKIKFIYRFIFIVLLFVFISVNVFIISNAENNFNTIVIAHRGSSSKKLENTIEAVNLASKFTNHIEIDVVLTKDKEVVLSHDLNLKRLSGLDVLISEMKSKDLKQMDLVEPNLGFKGRIISLKNLIKKIDKKVILYIEIKNDSKNYKELTKKVYDIIKGTNHIVCALDYKVLKYIKSIDSSIKTCYILPVALGGIENISHVDIFSVEESFLTKKLVEKIHHNNKLVYGWTINERDKVAKLIAIGVDGVITDEPEEISDEVYFESFFVIQTRLLNLFKR